MKIPTLVSIAALAAALVDPHPALAQVQPTYQEQFRPQYHFTPAKNWMNDPNGLVSYRGKHHLFYQYSHFGNTWDFTISWGHAVWRGTWCTGKSCPSPYPQRTLCRSSLAAPLWMRRTVAASAPEVTRRWFRSTPSFIGRSGIDPTDGWVIPQGTQAQAIAFSTDEGLTWTP